MSARWAKPVTTRDKSMEVRRELEHQVKSLARQLKRSTRSMRDAKDEIERTPVARSKGRGIVKISA